jgi:hypothetical protein
MAKKRTTAAAAPAAAPDAHAEKAAMPVENRADAATVDPRPHDAAGVDGQVVDVEGEFGPGEQIDGQGLDPIRAAEPVATGYKIKSKRAGFRRAGRAWSTDWTDVPAADLSDDQVAAILAEPMLAVVIVAE